jgi:hypothetical protein
VAERQRPAAERLRRVLAGSLRRSLRKRPADR